MARYGKIGEFDPEKEDWDLYVERLTYYFAANDVKDDRKQKAILLSVIGADSYKLVRNLVMPATPADKSFAEIVEVMKEHQNPTPSAIVQRYKFNNRNQKSNEVVADFVAELRQIAKHCDYQDKLDEMLRDRLVSGLRNERIQRRLLAEPDLTFARAKEIAVGMETAEKNSHVLADQSKVAVAGTVNQLSKGKYPATKSHETKCGRCGGKHMAHTCKFKDATCYKCNKKGHIARECRSKGNASSEIKPKEQRPRQFKRDRATNLLEEDNAGEEYAMFKVSDNKASPLQVQMIINGINTTMEVDTGAALTVTSRSTCATTCR